MSKIINSMMILTACLLIGNTAMAATPDGTIDFKQLQRAIEKVKIQAAQDTNTNTKKEAKQGLLEGISTNFNVDVDTQAVENEPVDVAALTANLGASKGPVYVNFQHTRSYYRDFDANSGQRTNDFSGMVNNKVTIGFRIIPDSSQGGVEKTKVAVVDGRVRASSAE